MGGIQGCTCEGAPYVCSVVSRGVECAPDGSVYLSRGWSRGLSGDTRYLQMKASIMSAQASKSTFNVEIEKHRNLTTWVVPLTCSSCECGWDAGPPLSSSWGPC